MGNCIQRETGIEDSDEDKIDDEKLVGRVVYLLNLDCSKTKMER